MSPASFPESPHSACVSGSTAEYATNQVAASTRLVHSAASHAPEPGANGSRKIALTPFSGGGGEAHGDAPRAEGLAEFLEAAGDGGAAVPAGALVGEMVVADVVPVANDDGSLGRRAVGRAASYVFHVPSIYVDLPGGLTNLP